MTLDDPLPFPSEVSSIKRGIEMSWSFSSLPGSRGPSLQNQHRKADLCPQKLRAEGEEKRSQSLGSSAGGWFPAMLIFQNSRTQDSLEGEQQHYIISRRGPELSVQFPWFPLALCSPSFAATDLAHPVSRLYMWLYCSSVTWLSVQSQALLFLLSQGVGLAYLAMLNELPKESNADWLRAPHI